MTEHGKSDNDPITQLKNSLAALNQEVVNLKKGQAAFDQKYEAKIERGLGKSDFAAVLGAAALANIGFSALKVDETGVFLLGKQLFTWPHLRTPQERVAAAEKKLAARTDQLQTAVTGFREKLAVVEDHYRELEETRRQRAQPGNGSDRGLYGAQRFQEERLGRELRSLDQMEGRVRKAEARVRGSREKVVTEERRIEQAEEDARRARRETESHLQSLNRDLRGLGEQANQLRERLG
ncbi:hypothetical protein [Streptomyces milbemycinicus]|uniref:Uncharacterized protein n=1 Tax=Streptomyces milbemycinicus TaxID=476552 RepID=A0ABW8LDP0_9ACTN